MRFPGLFRVTLAITLTLIPASPATAQDENQEEPYYIVQEGDSLWQIAARFGIAVEELQRANNISDPAQVVIGARLVLPQLSGVSGELSTTTISYGETLRSLSRRYRISEAGLARLNRLVSPTELYAGVPLIVPVGDNRNTAFLGRASLAAGQSLLELAVLRGEDPWLLTLDNNLPGTWAAVPADALQVTGTSPEAPSSGLPPAITRVDLDPLRFVQGGTVVVKVFLPPGTKLRGSIAERTLKFFPQEYGYVALQGIHAQTLPGLYPLTLEGELASGERFAFSQNVLIQEANFPFDPSLEVDPTTVDPAVTEPENELWASLAVPATAEKMWNGLFSSPVPADFKDCWTSFFGNRRS